MSELRVAYIVPALKAADEASAAAAIDARGHPAEDAQGLRPRRLQGVRRHRHPAQRQARCDEPETDERPAGRAREGLSQRPRRKSRRDPGSRRRQRREARALLAEAGFQPADFDRLSRLARLPNEAACDLALKVTTRRKRCRQTSAAR